MTSEWAFLTICEACFGTRGPGQEASHGWSVWGKEADRQTDRKEMSTHR